MATLLPLGRTQFFSNAGVPLAGGSVYTYIVGTTTNKTTWQDPAGTIANTNPVVLDSAGTCLLYGIGAYRIRVFDALNNLIWDAVTSDTFTDTSTFALLASPMFTGTVSAPNLVVSTSLSGAGVNALLASPPPIGSGAPATGAFTSLAASGTISGQGFINWASSPPIIGNTTPNQGNFTILNATTAIANVSGSTVILGGSVSRTLQSKFSETVSVLDFGAKGDGVTDDTAAFIAAIAAMPAFGGILLVPPTSAFYLTSSTINISKPGLYHGCGLSSTIKTNNATADIFSVTNQQITISDLFISTTVTKTGGKHIAINGSGIQCTIRRCTLDAIFTGIDISGAPSSVHVADVIIQNPAGNGSQTGISIGGGTDLIFRDILITGNPAHNLGNAIAVSNVGDVTFDHVVTIWGGDGCAITPGVGQTCQLIFISNSDFDTCSGAGLTVQGAGTVQLLKVHDTWIASNGNNGVALIGPGLIQQTDLVNCVISNNTGAGVSIGTNSAAYTRIDDCSISANTTHGVVLVSNVQNLKITNNTIGQSGEFGGNGQWGIAMSGTGYDNFWILDNELSGGNGSGSLLFSPGTTPGQSFWVARNEGFVTQIKGVLTTSAGPSTFTVTHGLSATPTLKDIQLQLQSGLGSASYFYVSNVTATTFDIVFNAAPGAGVNIGYSARILGT